MCREGVFALEYLPEGLEVVGTGDGEGHVEVLLIDGFSDFVIDCNLILPVSHVHKHAVVVAAFSLAHEVLAVLDGAEQNLDPVGVVMECLHAAISTRKASAADVSFSNVTYAVMFL